MGRAFSKESILRIYASISSIYNEDNSWGKKLKIDDKDVKDTYWFLQEIKGDMRLQICFSARKQGSTAYDHSDTHFTLGDYDLVSRGVNDGICFSKDKHKFLFDHADYKMGWINIG